MLVKLCGLVKVLFYLISRLFNWNMDSVMVVNLLDFVMVSLGCKLIIILCNR